MGSSTLADAEGDGYVQDSACALATDGRGDVVIAGNTEGSLFGNVGEMAKMTTCAVCDRCAYACVCLWALKSRRTPYAFVLNRNFHSIITCAGDGKSFHAYRNLFYLFYLFLD